MIERKQRPYLGIAQRTRKSPFYDATIRHGVQAFSVYNHMLIPLVYESLEADYWHLLNGVTLWDVACERQLEIVGTDASRLVQLMTPRNLSTMQVGQCKYIPIVDHKGGLLNDPVLLRLDENQYWLSLADSDVLLYALGLALGYGLDVQIDEPDVSPLAIQGPRADEVAAAVLGAWVRDLRFFWFKPFMLDDIPLLVARSGWSKQGGVELYLRDSAKGEALWERVWQGGRPFDIKPGAPNLIERIEGGLLSYGNDMTRENNPFEVGLERYCDLEQEADFIGKVALQNIRAKGIEKKLVGLFIAGDRLPSAENYWLLRAEGASAGNVTSATYSPRLKRNIAIGMVAIQYAEVGAQLTAVTPHGERRATVTELPFIQ